MHVAVALLAGYALGSLPTGVIVARLRGVDIRTVGSGNIGATNVARALGKKLGVLVLLVDAAKGFLPVFLTIRLWPQAHALHAGVGLAASLGHIFPVWLRFRGGKGVATGFGVFLALAPLAAGIAAGLYVALYAAFRISSIGSLVAATSVPATLLIQRAPWPYLVLAMGVWTLVVLRHRGNIRRLVKREETKV